MLPVSATQKERAAGADLRPTALALLDHSGGTRSVQGDLRLSGVVVGQDLHPLNSPALAVHQTQPDIHDAQRSLDVDEAVLPAQDDGSHVSHQRVASLFPRTNARRMPLALTCVSI